MKFRKLLLIIIVALCMVIFFAGCGKDEEVIEETTYLKISREITLVVGNDVDLNIETNISDKTKIIWTTDNANIATVENGNISAVSQGRTTIKASYENISAMCTVTVVSGKDVSNISLKFEKIEQVVSLGESAKLSVIIKNGDSLLNDQIQLTTDNPDIVEIERIGESNSFNINTKKTGVVTINAEFGDLTAVSQIIVKEANASTLPKPEVNFTEDGIYFVLDSNAEYYLIKSSNGQYYEKNVDGSFKFDLNGNGVQNFDLYIRAIAAKDNPSYYSSETISIPVLLVQNEATYFDGDFVCVSDGKIKYNSKIFGANLIVMKDDEPISEETENQDLLNFGDFASLNFYAETKNKNIYLDSIYGSKIIYDGENKQAISSLTNSLSSTSFSISRDSERGNVLAINMSNNSSKSFMQFRFETDKDLSEVANINYMMKIDGVVDAFDSGLFYIPNIPGSQESRVDGYVQYYKFFSNPVRPDDGWVKVELTGLDGINTCLELANGSVIKPISYDEATNKYCIDFFFINRWDAEFSGANAKTLAVTLLIDDIQIGGQRKYLINNNTTQNGTFTTDKISALADETVTIISTPDTNYEIENINVLTSQNEKISVSADNTFEMPSDNVSIEIIFSPKGQLLSSDSKTNIKYFGYNGQDVTGPRLNIIEDDTKGKVFEFDAAATNVTHPSFKITTRKDLSRVYAISYDIKLISVSDNTEWAFVPNLAGSDQDRGDGYALSQTSIGKNLTIADGWQNVKLTGLNKALSSIVYNEATGEYTLEFKYINRFVSASGSARVFKFALCNLVYYAEDDNVIWDGATSELSKAVRNDTTNIQSVTMVDDVTRGKVLQVVSPAGKYPYLKITTKADLSAVTSISYHIKLVTNTGYTEGLSLLPAIPGGNSDRTDNYTSSTHLIGEQLNSTSGWVKVTLTGLNGTSTRKGETNYITYDEATGLYTIHLVWINRYDGSNNSIVGTVLLDDFMIEI